MDDFSDTIGGSVLVPTSTTLTGRIDTPTDRDVFAVELEEGERLFVSSFGLRSGQRIGPDADARLDVMELAVVEGTLDNVLVAAGTVFAGDDFLPEGGLANVSVDFRAPSAGTYHVVVDGQWELGRAGPDIGQYELELEYAGFETSDLVARIDSINVGPQRFGVPGAEITLEYSILNIGAGRSSETTTTSIELFDVADPEVVLLSSRSFGRGSFEPDEERTRSTFFNISEEHVGKTLGFRFVVDQDNSEPDNALTNNRASATFLAEVVFPEVLDTMALDRLAGSDDIEIFRMLDDGERDVVTDFNIFFDRFDVSAWGVTGFADLEITNLVSRTGQVRWIQVADKTGEAEMIVRYANNAFLDADLLDADNFIFLDGPPPVIERKDTAARDQLAGTAEPERFVLIRDGQRDIIRDFDVTQDKIDVSAWPANSLDDLSIENVTNRTGDVRWVSISPEDGVAEVVLRFTEGTPLSASALTADQFVFGSGPLLRTETSGTDRLDGTAEAEVFQLLNDGQRDQIRNFDPDMDLLDVSALPVRTFNELEIVNLTNRAGETRWVQISDPEGEAELILRFTEGTPLRASVLTADQFVFGDGPVAPLLRTETSGTDRLDGTAAAEVFQLVNDGQRDQIRNFDPDKDLLDVSAWSVRTFSELEIVNLTNRVGDTRWVQVTDTDGEAELILRFAEGFPLDAATLSAEDFIFETG